MRAMVLALLACVVLGPGDPGPGARLDQPGEIGAGLSLRTPLLYRGADMSFVPQYVVRGRPYYDAGVARDPIRILADKGCNLLRVRLWVDPEWRVNGIEQALGFARRADELGMGLMLDFHYADSWADPGQQWTPARWWGLPPAVLGQRVREYTRDVLLALDGQGTPPAIVQVGNEITPGFLWPQGRISQAGFDQFADLLKQAIAGVDDAMPVRPLVMIHIDRGGDNATCRWFYDNLESRGVAYDAIGLSYYPFWHGELATMSANLHDLAARYGKRLMIVETAYPFTLGNQDDGASNFVWQQSQLLPGYDATPAGQKAFLDALTAELETVPDCLGWCYWAPEYVSAPGLPTPWENLSLWDFSLELLPAADAFGP